MNVYSSIIRTTYLGVFIGGLITYWGVEDNGIFRIIIGFVIVCLFLKSCVDNIRFEKNYRQWKTDINGQVFFFYPSNKNSQRIIENEILPLLPPTFLKICYQGPTLVGTDIKNIHIKHLMNEFGAIDSRCPAIFKIRDNKLFIEELPELKVIDKVKIDYKTIHERIEKIASI